MQLFYNSRRPKLMESLYDPFPISIFQRKGCPIHHSFRLLLIVCVDGAHKAYDSSVFQSSVGADVLFYKLRTFA